MAGVEVACRPPGHSDFPHDILWVLGDCTSRASVSPMGEPIGYPQGTTHLREDRPQDSKEPREVTGSSEN